MCVLIIWSVWEVQCVFRVVVFLSCGWIMITVELETDLKTKELHTTALIDKYPILQLTS